MGNRQPKLNQTPKPSIQRQDLQSEKDSENGTDFTCEICIEPNNLANKFRNAKKCSHPFCTDCATTYIRSKLEDDHTCDIKCPFLDCVHMLDPFDCTSLIGRPMFLRWTDLMCEAAIVGLNKCYCPSISCNELILNECGGKPKKTQCPKCKSWFCFQCKIHWHSGFKCGESLELRDDNDVKFGRLAELNKWGRCPQCGHFCEKVEGCKNIKCRCGTDFCYMCGGRTHDHLCDSCDVHVNWCIRWLGMFFMILFFFLGFFIGFS